MKRIGTFLLASVLLIVLISCPEPTISTPVDKTFHIGLVAPVYNAKAEYEIDETDQFTGTVVWDPDPAEDQDYFLAHIEYRAIITLDPKEGYNLEKIGKNGFTVPGALKYSWNEETGVIEADYHKTLGFNIAMVEIPAGKVTLPNGSAKITYSYQMGKYEVSQAEFEQIMGGNPSDTNVGKSNDHPVQKVSWYHAIAFCNKLSIAEGLSPVYSVEISGKEVDWLNLTFENFPDYHKAWDSPTQNINNTGYRLPTEMEWLLAAGSITDKFSGYKGNSNTIGNYVNYSSNSGKKTVSVSSKIANTKGLHNMSGNVSEWCWDKWVDGYPSGTLTDYMGPKPKYGNARVHCGGDFETPDKYLAFEECRLPETPGDFYSRIGFRVVRK